VAIPLANPFFRLFTGLQVLNPRRTLFTDGRPDPGVEILPLVGLPSATGEDLHTEVSAFRVGEGSFAVMPTELDPQIGETYRAAMAGAGHTFIVGLGNDQIGYQVPFAKWDDSCHACFLQVLIGVPGACPIQPVDCSTVFINNVGQEVDPAVSDALLPLLDQLH